MSPFGPKENGKRGMDYAPPVLHGSQAIQPSLLYRQALKRALTVNVEILNDYSNRFPIRTNPESNRAQPTGIFPLRLVEEGIAVPVPQGKRLLLRPEPKKQGPVLVHHFKVA